MVIEQTGTNTDADDAEFERLVEEGIKAVRLGDHAHWRLGDLALQVTARYSRTKRLQDYADRIGVSYPLLASCRRVAGVFPESSRRSQLSWSHHFVVVGRKDADELLAKAEQEGLSVRQLARIVRPDSEKSKGLVVQPPRLGSEDNASLAVDLLEQVVADERPHPLTPDVQALEVMSEAFKALQKRGALVSPRHKEFEIE